MQSIENYAQQNDKLRLLLQGSAGSGKTTLACQFPNAYVIDVDVNLGGSIRYLKEHGLKLPIGFDVLDRDEKGEPVPMIRRFQRLNDLFMAAQKDDRIETIVVDSATTLCDVVIAETLRKQNKEKMTKQEWGFFGNDSRHIMSTFASIRKHIVFIAHEKLNKNEDGSIVYPVKVSWPGQVGQNIGVFFTNVWRCEVEARPAGVGQTNYHWKIRTMPDGKYELKNTLGLPPVFEFNWDLIQKKLEGAPCPK